MRSPVLRSLPLLAACGLALVSTAAQAAPNCPSWILAEPKTNYLYVYFPTVSDSSFPSYHASSFATGGTSPLAAFNISNLDPSVGTTAQLRDRIFDFVVDDYCEFNVEVSATTTAPSPTVPRWQVVGVGTDSATTSGGTLFGIAQDVDTNDATAQDYSRVFAKSFKDLYGSGAGNALSGANSTLERWATAIGETAAHEAAHNYGAAHGHSAPRPASAEDDVNWHIMATGSTGLTGAMRAGRNRHFSDTEYEILGYSIGLHTSTLHNWDFVNPNNSNADKMRIKLLSTSTSLSVTWWYGGSSSPWQNPTVTYTGNTQNFQGNTYYVHHLDFTTPKSWNGPTAGVVQPAADFHTGASFGSSVIVFDVELFLGSTLLPLAPRLVGYDAGDIDVGTGDFGVNIFNTDVLAGPLVLSEVQVFRSPRMIDINSMMRGAEPVDVRGLPIEFLSSTSFKTESVQDRLRLPIAKLSDPRTVDILYGPDDCPTGAVGGTLSVGDADPGEIDYCEQGNALSLFPVTYTYLIAKVTDPNARYWDPERREFVTGPLSSVVYYQFAGIQPDLNNNGVDDLLDIRAGTSRDQDRNGVPDEVRAETTRQ